MQINISSWNELRDEVIRLMVENEQLKQDKQALTNELVNLKLQVKQAERRREKAYDGLISEGKRCV